jgi:hypothetical protein
MTCLGKRRPLFLGGNEYHRSTLYLVGCTHTPFNSLLCGTLHVASIAFTSIFLHGPCVEQSEYISLSQLVTRIKVAMDPVANSPFWLAWLSFEAINT